MSRFSILRTTIKEIIDLSKRSDILADQKSKQFCNFYLNLKNEDADLSNADSKGELMKTLSKEHGLKLDKLYNKVNF